MAQPVFETSSKPIPELNFEQKAAENKNLDMEVTTKVNDFGDTVYTLENPYKALKTDQTTEYQPSELK